MRESAGATASQKPGGHKSSWHWPRDTQLKKDDHRYREVNGVQILATLRSLATNALRLAGFWSITDGLAALVHNIPGLPALLGWRETAQVLSCSLTRAVIAGIGGPGSKP